MLRFHSVFFLCIAYWRLILGKDVLNLSGHFIPPALQASSLHRKQPLWLHTAAGISEARENNEWGFHIRKFGMA